MCGTPYSRLAWRTQEVIEHLQVNGMPQPAYTILSQRHRQAPPTGLTRCDRRKFAGNLYVSNNVVCVLPCTQCNGMHMTAAEAANALVRDVGSASDGEAQWAARLSIATPMAVDVEDEDALLVVPQVAPWIDAGAPVGFHSTGSWGMQPAGCSMGLAVNIVESTCTSAAEHLPHGAAVGQHALKRKISHIGSGIGFQTKPSLVQPAADRVRRCVQRRGGTAGMSGGRGPREQANSQHGRQQQQQQSSTSGAGVPFGAAIDDCTPSGAGPQQLQAASFGANDTTAGYMDIDIADSLTVATQRSLSLN